MSGSDAHPGPRAGLGGAIVAAAAAATVGTVAEACAFPGATGVLLLGTKFLVLWPGNLVAALGLAVAACLLAGPPRRPVDALAWWWGLAPGLGALAGGLLADPRNYEGPWAWAVPAATAALLVAAFLLAGSLPRPPRALEAGTAAAGLLAFLLLLGGVGADHVEREVRYDVAARPELGTAEGPLPAAGAPDVLLISVDTLRADAVAGSVPLPHLDALRAHSLWSDHALAPAPATLPSHVTMFTGVNPLEHGTRANTGRLPEAIPTLAERFRASGWRTLAVVSNGVLRRGTGVERGFEIYENLSTTHADVAVAKALQAKAGRASWLGVLLVNPLTGRFGEPFYRKVVYFLLGRRLETAGAGDIGAARGALTRDLALAFLDDLEAQDRPWFFFLHFMDPHQPYDPDPSVAGRLTGDSAMPPDYRGEDPGSLLMARTIMADLELGRSQALEAAQYLHRVYLEEVLFTDACIGRVLERARAAGRPLLILFTSDHGEQFGEHGLMIHNNSVYEPLLRVPFILAGPGVPPGKLDAPPHLEDIAPTLLSLCGLPVPSRMAGRDLLADAPAEERPYVGTSGDEMAVYEGGWKLILGYAALGTADPQLEARALYHVAVDPAEERNRLDTETEIRDRLFALARSRAAQARQAMQAELSDQERAMLDELGYGEGGG